MTRYWLVLPCMFVCAVGVSFGQNSEELASEDPAELREMFETQARDQARHLSKAYGLSDSDSVALERELLSRVDAEIALRPAFRAAALQVAKAYEAEVIKHGEDWMATSDERKRLEAPLNEILEKEPLTLENCQKFVESKLAPDRVEAGRKRLPEVQAEEAQAAQELVKSQQASEAQYAVAVGIASEANRKADAELSPAGNPMPKEEFRAPPPPAPVTPAPQIQRPVVAPPTAPIEKPRPAPRVEPPAHKDEPAAPPPQAPIESPRLTPAPPIDEWDRHVDSVAQKYKFSGEQKGKAQLILKDLRDRARQYRKSHTSDYERLKRITDGAERATEEKHLNQPLDELFAELKERLEVLPTQEQREMAGGHKG